MMGKLREIPKGKTILPFALLCHGQTSTTTIYDEHGQPYDVVQAEVGEQGDPVMPALYVFGQQCSAPGPQGAPQR